MKKLSKSRDVVDTSKKPTFIINDHIDILTEILKHLDGKSLCVSACVCKLWCTIARTDSIWENLCFFHVEGIRPVVVALGGYRRIYRECVRPVLSRLNELRIGELDRRRRVWTQLSVSLFCVDYYERFGAATPSSLLFLSNAVNV